MRRLTDLVVRWPLAVIGLWIAMAIALPLAVPSLGEMAQKHPLVILPGDAPSSVTAQKMTEAFKEPGSGNLLVIALIDETGLTPADEAVYRTLVDAIRDDVRDVVTVQDFVSTPQLRGFMTSEDKTTWVLPVTLEGELGTPRAFESFTRVAEIVERSVPGNVPGGLSVQITGPAATVADLTVAGEVDRLPIELAIAVLVLLVLLLVYRSAVTMLLPLVTIGGSLVIAQALVAGLLRTHGCGRIESVHRLSERDHGGRRNGLRGLPDQPLSRLRPVWSGVRTGRQGGHDVDWQGDHRVGGHGGSDLPLPELRQDGGVPDRRSVVGDRDRCRVPRRGDSAARDSGARRPPRMGQAAAGTDHPVLAALRHPDRAQAGAAPGGQPPGVGDPGQPRHGRALQLRRSQGGGVVRAEFDRLCRT